MTVVEYQVRCVVDGETVSVSFSDEYAALSFAEEVEADQLVKVCRYKAHELTKLPGNED